MPMRSALACMPLKGAGIVNAMVESPLVRLSPFTACNHSYRNSMAVAALSTLGLANAGSRFIDEFLTQF